MGSYSIRLKPSLDKDLRPLPKTIVVQVMARIEELQSEPFPSDAVKLSGAERLYRIRVGDYRIVYEVDKKGKRIIVYYVRHRREVYRKL